MDPLDPRHGTSAGNIAHWKAGEKPCEPCHTAGLKARKVRAVDAARGNPRTVPLGAAWDVIDRLPRKTLEARTGIRCHRLCSYHKAGPDRRVHRSTRDRILAAGRAAWTPIGIQRRLQALTAIGHSMREVSDLTGVHVDGLKRLRRRGTPQFVRSIVAEAVITAYRELCMNVPDPHSHTARRTLAAARTAGYAPPLSWTNIDDPSEQPVGIAGKEPQRRWIDPVVVMELLALRGVDATRAEKVEAMRRWLAAGKSARSLEVAHGWNQGRYVVREEEVA